MLLLCSSTSPLSRWQALAFGAMFMASLSWPVCRAFLCQPQSTCPVQWINSRSLSLEMAKSSKKKNKKKVSGGSSLKGFGSPAPTSDVDIDRSKPARDFYNFLSIKEAGDNTVRSALGFFPLEGDAKLRGVVALKDVKKGENLIRIPYDAAINLGQEGADPTIPALKFLREYCEVLNNESTEDDKHAYFKLLPGFQGNDCLGSTDFFSDEALDALQSPLIVEETIKRRELTLLRFQKDVDESFPSWIDGSQVTVDHLQWAVWLITSRVLTVQGAESEGKSYRLLIPYLDMCNHDRTSPHILTGRAVSGGELKVVAGSTVKQGDQINICYGGGMAGNDRFIQDYGFLDSSDNSQAYKMVAQQLTGKRRIVEGVGAGKLMSQLDRDRTLTALSLSTISEDDELLKKETDPQLKAAYLYRRGVKEALSKLA